MTPRLTQLRRWTPRTLAVVSFALAMLAAQPVVSAHGAELDRAVIMKDAGATVVSATQLTAADSPKRHVSLVSVDRARPAMRSHILTTLEILWRIVFAEVAPRSVERDVALIACFEPLCLETLPPAGLSHGPVLFPLVPPSAERAFAIHHFLLPPPQA